jgi:NADH dehydrogenase FAD-containing subunit
VNNPSRVVIIGGGLGGLCAARGLTGIPVNVTLIDKRNYHLFRPMLYQVATGLSGRCAHLFPDRVREPILRHAAMDNDVSNQTSAGADLSGTRANRRRVRSHFVKFG